VRGDLVVPRQAGTGQGARAYAEPWRQDSPFFMCLVGCRGQPHRHSTQGQQKNKTLDRETWTTKRRKSRRGS
jgi:hypothetical protein